MQMEDEICASTWQTLGKWKLLLLGKKLGVWQ